MFGTPTVGAVKIELIQEFVKALGFNAEDVQEVTITPGCVEVYTFAWNTETRRWNNRVITYRCSPDGRRLENTGVIAGVTHTRNIEW